MCLLCRRRAREKEALTGGVDYGRRGQVSRCAGRKKGREVIWILEKEGSWEMNDSVVRQVDRQVNKAVRGEAESRKGNWILEVERRIIR